MALNRKYLGVRFPFTAKDDEKFFVDMEYNPYEEIKSDIMHLLFTSTNERLRNPSFGTNLLKYIFEPNEEKTQTDIKIELQTVISRYFPGISVDDIKITKNIESDNGINIEFKYQINEGVYKTFDSININI